jgi:hypothetical protein
VRWSALLAPALAAGCVADTGSLEGLGALDVVPAAIRFGTIGGDCGPYERPVTVANDGGQPVRVERIALRTGAAFRVVALPEPLPERALTLQPGTKVEVRVRFAATADGVYRDVLEVAGQKDGRAFTEEVALEGRVAADRTRVDVFRQGATGDADVLFVIDNSCSMVAEQDALTRNFRSFIEITDSGLLAFHLGVTTTDVSASDEAAQGRLLPLAEPREARVVTRASLPSPLDAFTRNGRVGIEGSGDEAGLEAARLALSAALLEDHNFGFLREHALLSLIFISDEQDLSPLPVSTYVDLFVALKGGDASRVTASAVVGPPGGCGTGRDNTATYAPRYIEVAETLGGAVESICDPRWDEILGRLSSTAFGLRARFPLSERPDDPGALEVRVDGALVPVTLGSWRYDPGTNAVLFAPREIPGPGAEVTIRYRTVCGGV